MALRKNSVTPIIRKPTSGENEKRYKPVQRDLAGRRIDMPRKSMHQRINDEGDRKAGLRALAQAQRTKEFERDRHSKDRPLDVIMKEIEHPEMEKMLKKLEK